MADVHSKEIRSYNMSCIRSKDTKPEMLVRRFFHKNGLRYRLHVKNLPGKPDIVLPKYKTVIFVHGCFWHGHDTCNTYLKPKSNVDFWNQKMESNIARDKMNVNKIRSLGWSVLIIWECELKAKLRKERLENLVSFFKNSVHV